MAPEHPAAQAAPLYLIATSFTAGDQRETYLVTSKTFDASTTINPSSGVKLLGGVVPLVHNESVFVSSQQEPVITRYDIGPGDTLVKGPEVSFAGAGVAEVASWYVYLVSDTKGYVFDPGGPRIVVWNPSTMKLTGTQIDLKAAARPGLTPGLALEQTGPRKRGAELFIPTSWTDQDGNYRHATGVTILDTEKDQLVSVIEDERCGEAYMSVSAPGGDLYFFPSADSSTQHFFVEGKKPTCVLRVKAGERTFDPAFSLNLSALGTGSAAVGAVPDGANGFFFASADEGLYARRASNGDAYFRFYHYDFTTQAARAVPSLPAWAGSTYWVDVGGKTVLPYWSESGGTSRTAVYTTNGAADPTPLFSFDASWYGLARLR